MPIRIQPNVVYGTFKSKWPHWKTTDDGKAYVKDEQGNNIQDGWDYYTYHMVCANCLCAIIYKYKDPDTGERMYHFNYEFFADAAHAQRCFKGGWGGHIASARFNIDTKEGRTLAAIFVQGGIKVTPYHNRKKKGTKK